ncbi:Cytochrome c, mono-and diheme variants [Devosia psychrophila]|uniref:Cytochrome c, mono-and diheme variants n=1 Tax=Devosia psychrophila TaxID=728005 RepID=A0A1I1RXV8_9HYPH|nr:Cytochrome c, mono-and diheme variants [Devosia psychrophila]
MVPARSLIALTLLIAAVGETKADDHGRLLYVERCASCHGEQLQGQPDWMKRLPNGRLPAPPHDASGHTWHHSDDQLMRIVRDGLASIAPGYETDMPAFRAVLTEAEIRSVLDYIKTTWPDRERGYQEARSEGNL